MTAAASPLDSLVEKLSVLRNVVEYTTRPGDPARDALQFGSPLKATRALPTDAAKIVAGARSVRSRFPALTPAVLDSADEAIRIAFDHVERARDGEVDRAARRADQADDRQLALDVLLDSINHLRAAARAALSATRPRLAEVLTAPIETTSRTTPATPPEAPAEPLPGATPI